VPQSEALPGFVFCLWVTQRFTAAMFSMPASAAEVMLAAGEALSPRFFEDRPHHNTTDTIVQLFKAHPSAFITPCCRFNRNLHFGGNRKGCQMDGTNGLKESTRVTTPVASNTPESNTLSVNVFTAPGKAMVGERPKPFGEAFGFDPITSTLIFGEYDAVLVDAMGTVAEAEALAAWVALHNRNLETIYITHAHFDHFYGLSILLDRFPGARAIATPKTTRSLSRVTNCALSSRAAPIVPIRRLSTFHRSA